MLAKTLPTRSTKDAFLPIMAYTYEEDSASKGIGGKVMEDSNHKMPEISKNLTDRIRLVRRDVGELLFHFTRTPEKATVSWSMPGGGLTSMSSSAFAVLYKILSEGKLEGTSTWTYGQKCICFTEAPITEFNSIFSLVAIAALKQERPRYEPYGVAVSKKWLFEQGGRPVIYDHPDAFENFPQDLRYRFVPYNPVRGINYTWEREWRIKTDVLRLDPKHTLVIVPTADEAFELVYDFARIEADWDVEGGTGEGHISGFYHVPRWLAVSLDIFGFSYSP